MHSHEVETETDRLLWKKFKEHSAALRKTKCLDDDRLSAYLTHRVSVGELEMTEEHLVVCPACSAKVMEMRLLLEARPKEIPPGLIEKAQALVSGKDPLHKKASRLPVWRGLLGKKRSQR